MSAGQLRERVAFGHRPTTPDEYGNVLGDFAEQFTVAARIQPLRGSEEVMAARLAGRQPVIIRVRYSSQTSQIGSAWQARDVRKGTLYNIRSIANMDERKRFFDILADTGGAVG